MIFVKSHCASPIVNEVLSETIEPNQENKSVLVLLLLPHWLGAPANIWLGVAGKLFYS